jgi:predicted TIM-barrel fold metal-dependent hydrolase
MIHGVTHGRFLDDVFFFPVLERAGALNVPIYLHPAPPPEPVFQAYFSDLDPAVSLILSTAGWGWHSETALHTLRLIAAGVFDRFPQLQLIIGHMGEMIPFQLARIDRALTRAASKLRQSPAAYFQSNIHITTSGLFTTPPLELTLQVLGADRVLFSIDYPYSGNEVGRAFLDSLALHPEDFDKITHRNAERLLGLG